MSAPETSSYSDPRAAFGMAFEGTTLKQGIEATVQELQALEPQCAPALSQDGSTP